MRDSAGNFHCFGCGESGDVFTFVQKIQGLDFYEALEFVAGRCGITIQWEERSGGEYKGARNSDEVKRSRVLEINKITAKFFADALNSDEAKPARAMLSERNFSKADCEHFGCGYAPRGRDNLVRHLSEKGYTHPELEAAGVVTKTAKGLLDRFQGRVIWPIRDVTGDVLGFGARKLYDDDFFDAKYLNTSETRVYKKSKVLYGIDLARKPISAKREVVVVEGYTDVMAMHLAGIDTAVASCGTAFGSEHANIIRRLMGDTDEKAIIGGAQPKQNGRVVFTFDGDSAGLKAAWKSYEFAQEFMMQTYVAIVPDNMDPCDLRLKKGDLALKNLVDNAKPMTKFMIEATLNNFDLSSPEGRSQGTKDAAFIVAGLKDLILQSEYSRFLAEKTGVDASTVEKIVSEAKMQTKAEKENQARMQAMRTNGPQNNTFSNGQNINTTAQIPVLSSRDVNSNRNQNAQNSSSNNNIEKTFIALTLQNPEKVKSEVFSSVDPESFNVPFLKKVFKEMLTTGGVDIGSALGSAAWISEIKVGLSEEEQKWLTILSVTPIDISDEEQIQKYTKELAQKLNKSRLKNKMDQLRSQLSTLAYGSDEYNSISTEFIQMQREEMGL